MKIRHSYKGVSAAILMVLLIANATVYAHEVTYQGTVLTSEATRLQVKTIDAKTKKEDTLSFVVNADTKIKRGDKTVSYENAKIMEYTLKWMKAHPFQTITLSFEHMFDLAFGTLEWPSSAVPEFRPWVVLFDELFHVFVLFPVGLHLVWNAKDLLRLRPRVCGDLLIFMPVLAIAIVAFISLGEPRYRVPYDGFLLLLAARAYCGSRAEEPALAPSAA